MSNKRKKCLFSFSLLCLIVCFSSVNAATIPPDVKLASKQKLTRNNGTEPTSLDPHKVEGVPEATLLNDLLEGLVMASGEDGQIIPAAAERWQTEDNKIWLFYLRPEGKWSNGEPLTAEDFVYSFKRIVDPETNSPIASYLAYAQIANADEIIAGKKPVDSLGVKAIAPYTLQIELENPLPYFIKMLIHTAFKPVNRGAVEKFASQWTQPKHWVGNGAYKMRKWVVNEYITLERNPYYWDNHHTVIDRVKYLPISSASCELNRYKAGEIDLTSSNLPSELYQKVKVEFRDELHRSPTLCTFYYGFNNKEAPLDDVNVRTALKLGLDQKLIAYIIKNQGESPAYYMTPLYIDGAELMKKPDWANWSQEERNQKAIELLTASGYTQDRPLKLELLYPTTEANKKMAIAAASIWKKDLNDLIDIELINQEWKTYLDNLRFGHYQIASKGWCAGYNEASAFLNILLSNSSNNQSFYHNPLFDEIMQKAIEAKTEQERAMFYAQAQQLVDKDSVNAPAYYYVMNRLVKPYIGGYSEKNPFGMVYSKDLYIIEH